MGELILRDIDDRIIDGLRRRAARRGRRLEEEVREILATAARPTKEELLAEADRIRAMTPPGPHPLAEDLIREDRDSR